MEMSGALVDNHEFLSRLDPFLQVFSLDYLMATYLDYLYNFIIRNFNSIFVSSRTRS